MSQQSLMKNAIISGSIGFIITFLAFKYNKSKITKNDLICELIIKIGNKKVRLKALIDTGNSLKYSNTNDNVIIVEKNKIFSEDEFKKYIEEGLVMMNLKNTLRKEVMKMKKKIIKMQIIQN